MALDLIYFKTTSDDIRERSANTIRAAFRDQSTKTNVVPTNIFYRLDDDGTGQVLLDWTSKAVPTLPINYVDIVMTGEQNRILIDARETERKTLSVMVNRGLATQFVASFSYSVRNLGWSS